MTNSDDDNLQGLAAPPDVGNYLGIPIETLYAWRHRGVGPRSVRIGRHVRYRWSDVVRWVADQYGEPVDTNPSRRPIERLGSSLKKVPDGKRKVPSSAGGRANG